MAVKWAVADWNWNAGATWNDGVVPTSDDVVYCNGHTILMNVNNIVAKQIRNDVNPNTNIGGGFVQNNAGYTITADFYAVGTYIFYTSENSIITCTINGNIEVNNTSFTAINANAQGRNYVINGNITGMNTGSPLYFFNDGGRLISPTINGNFNAPNMRVMMGNTSATYTTLAVNGNCEADSLLGVKTPYVNCVIGGSLYLHSGNSAYITCNTILYDEGGLPVCLSNITPTNPTTFECRYVGTTPNPLPYVVINPNTIANTYPQQSDVLQGVVYGAQMELTGTYAPDYPQEAEVLQGVTYDNGHKTGTLTPVVLGDYPAEADVKVGVVFDYGNKVGTFQPVADYPAEADVLQGVEYAYGQMTGTLSVATDYPQEANVLQGVEYANGSMVGTLEVVQLQADYPSENDVRFDVLFDFGNKQGKCHVPIPEDVREGVLVDVNDVGTLIPSSGGDRLRIADFGYYTNAQSDTYIVDLTEQDKPKFAVAEERVLIEMFPDLDLDNIPDKYFDDLFVKYLKYRLIVEYYRTAGINSTFTPSEPTTEIVNYQNVRNEVWLNSANIYLKAWSKKFPESITKPQRILL